MSIAITPDQLTLETGQPPARLTATVAATGSASRAVHWTSDAPAIAAVSPIGDVSPLTPGTAHVTATSIEDPTKSATVPVTVTEGDHVISVEINQGDLQLAVGDTTTLTATVVTSGTASDEVTWESDAPLVATIDPATGHLEAVGEGSAIVTAASVDTPSAFDTITVTVTDPVAAVIGRCDLASEPAALYRDASTALLAAARSGSLPLADDTLLVAYQRPGTAKPVTLGAQASDPTLMRDVRSQYGLHVVDTVAPGLDRVRADDPWATAEALLRDDRVRYAHPNVLLSTAGVPNDARFGEQWNLASFGAPAAWDVENGSSAVTVALVDSGVDLSHPELSIRLDAGWDFYGSDPACETDRSCPGDDDPSTADIHGTHVTGIVGAQGDNLIGVSGVTRDGVRLLPIKVFDDAGGDRGGKAVAAVVSALRWVAGYPVDGPPPLAAPVEIANLSLGTAGTYTIVPALEDAVRTARARGVIVFASAGNEGTSEGITAPANGPCAIAVGSVDEDLELSWFSNYDSDGRTVDLVAPGGISNEGKAVLSTTPGGGYGYLSGVSMATAYVSGSAALLASHQPTWDGARLLEEVLRRAYLPSGAEPVQVGMGVMCVDALLGLGDTCGLP